MIMGCIGPVVIISHFFFIKAYQYAEASVLAPIHYFEIVSNVLISIIFFNDIPTIAVSINPSNGIDIFDIIIGIEINKIDLTSEDMLLFILKISLFTFIINYYFEYGKLYG